MIDESLGKNTKVKKIIRDKFIENVELQRKIGKTTEDLKCKEIKVINCRKKGFYWTADIKISYRINGCRVPVKVINRILGKEEM